MQIARTCNADEDQRERNHNKNAADQNRPCPIKPDDVAEDWRGHEKDCSDQQRQGDVADDSGDDGGDRHLSDPQPPALEKPVPHRIARKDGKAEGVRYGVGRSRRQSGAPHAQAIAGIAQRQRVISPQRQGKP